MDNQEPIVNRAFYHVAILAFPITLSGLLGSRKYHFTIDKDFNTALHYVTSTSSPIKHASSRFQNNPQNPKTQRPYHPTLRLFKISPKTILVYCLLTSIHIVSCLYIITMYYLDSISINLDNTTLSKPVEEGRLSPPKFLKYLPEPPAYDESPGTGG